MIDSSSELGVNNTPSFETATPSYVPDKYFKNSLIGNIIYPQRGLAQTLFVTESLVGNLLYHDPEKVWSVFERSKLSPQQIKEMGKAMSAVHHGKSIKLAAADQLKQYKVADPYTNRPGLVSDKVVPDNQFSALWDQTKEGVTQFLARYISSLDGSLINPTNGKEIYEKTVFFTPKVPEFVTNPANRKSLNSLRDFLVDSKLLFESSEGKRLTKAFRDTFDRRGIDDQTRTSHIMWNSIGTRRASEAELIQFLQSNLGEKYPDLKNFIAVAIR